MVETLEALCYGSEYRQTVEGSNPRFAIGGQENPLCQPNSKWVPLSNQGKIRQPKEGMVLPLRYIKQLTCNAYTATRK